MSAAQTWAVRVARFFLSVLALCAIGAALGAVVFPIAGGLGGSHKSSRDLVLLGARTGGFFFLVWAPGLALVREFVLAARPKTPAESVAGKRNAN